MKDFWEKECNKWNLKLNDSEHKRNFGAVDKGDRFEIQEQSKPAYFNLRFMLYSAGKDDYIWHVLDQMNITKASRPSVDLSDIVIDKLLTLFATSDQ